MTFLPGGKYKSLVKGILDLFERSIRDDIPMDLSREEVEKTYSKLLELYKMLDNAIILDDEDLDFD